MIERSHIDLGYRTWNVRTRWVSVQAPMRLLSVAIALLVTAICVALLALCLGDFPLTVTEVLGAVTGTGEEFARMVVVEWRMPIAIAAVVFGALLGLGGAIFQSLTRNPLGSPDVIGFDAGSYTAVVIVILMFGRGDSWSLTGASLIGGLATAVLVYMLSYRRGIQGFRLIVIGIGVSAMLGSMNAYLITRAEITDAMTVGFWGAGSIARITWSSLIPSLVIASMIFCAAAALAPALRRLELGDDAAITQGARVNRERIALLVVGVATTSLVTAAAGPIGFVALAAPQVARRLTRSAGVNMLGGAAMGAALLVCAHAVSLLTAQVFRPVPVGLITVCLGGVYLIWLLIREARKQYGGVRP
ncbi:MAG: FecCD family ABC transporter permease [Leucobacter sp.]